MCRHLSTVDRPLGAHGLLDKSVASLRLDGRTTLVCYNVLCIPDDAGVMNNLRTCLFFQKD